MDAGLPPDHVAEQVRAPRTSLYAPPKETERNRGQGLRGAKCYIGHLHEGDAEEKIQKGKVYLEMKNVRFFSTSKIWVFRKKKKRNAMLATSIFTCPSW